MPGLISRIQETVTKKKILEFPALVQKLLGFLVLLTCLCHNLILREDNVEKFTKLVKQVFYGMLYGLFFTAF